MTLNALAITLASGDPLDVREFTVEESMSRLFDVRVTAVSSSVDVDFEGAIGGPARFEILRTSPVDGETRYWSGICAGIEQIAVEEAGLSTYTIHVVPKLWMLTQRRNYKVFQDKSELDVVLEVLGGWGIQPTLQLDAGAYPKRRFRVQYAESDFDFVNRLLEDIGVAYYFEQSGGDTSLVLVDCPNKGPQRVPVGFVDKPNERVAIEYVTEVRSRRQVRPGRYTQSDVDYRKALNYPLASSSAQGNAVEGQLERYHHNYGSFLWKAEGGGDTPHADDRGPARTNEREGAKQVAKRLDAQRVDARMCAFRTIAHDLKPGKVFTIVGHPRGEIASPLLVVSSTFSGIALGDWMHRCEARYTDVDYRPPLRTPKPRTLGVESATVTGPAGEEIHTDEFGRVRVHFHWDREGASDETSSCWVPQSQPWAGAGFGSTSLARVGQEVLVDFLGADPDRPVVVGRVFTTTTPPPYQLPKFKMVSGHRSESYPRPKSGGAQARLGGGLAEPSEMEGLGIRARFPASPAGGGLAPSGLGGHPEPAAAAPEPAAATPMPGLRGGPQASIDDLNKNVEQLKSQGPDLMDHHRSANAVMHDDTANSEKMYIQAQKNLYETVKNDLIGSVGGNRGFTILGNDTTGVQHFQVTEVGDDRSIAVGKNQLHMIYGDTAIVATPNGSQAFIAAKVLAIQVGGDEGSSIIMTPTAIVIDAKKTYINPGPEVMADIHKGKSVEAAVAAAERRDRINKGSAALTKAMKDMHLDNSTGARNTLARAAAGKPDPGDGTTRILSDAGVKDPIEQQEAAQQTQKSLGPIDPARSTF
jgi:type VI secretion system secreted protein VgrG